MNESMFRFFFFLIEYYYSYIIFARLFCHVFNNQFPNLHLLLQYSPIKYMFPPTYKTLPYTLALPCCKDRPQRRNGRKTGKPWICATHIRTHTHTNPNINNDKSYIYIYQQKIKMHQHHSEDHTNNKSEDHT